MLKLGTRDQRTAARFLYVHGGCRAQPSTAAVWPLIGLEKGHPGVTRLPSSLLLWCSFNRSSLPVHSRTRPGWHPPSELLSPSNFCDPPLQTQEPGAEPQQLLQASPATELQAQSSALPMPRSMKQHVDLLQQPQSCKEKDDCLEARPLQSEFAIGQQSTKALSDVVQPEGAALTLMWPHTTVPVRFHMQTLCCRLTKRPLTPSSARRAVQPIAALNPYNMNWTIKARLIKADRFEFNNKQGVPSCRAKLEVVDEEVGKWGLFNV